MPQLLLVVNFPHCRRSSYEIWRLKEGIEESFSIGGEIGLEYYGGQIHTKGGPPVVLLGGIVENKPAERFLVMINDASREEVEKLAEFVATMRQKEKK